MATFCSCFLFGKNKARRKDPNLASYSALNGDVSAKRGLLIWNIAVSYSDGSHTDYVVVVLRVVRLSMLWYLAHPPMDESK